MLLTPFISKSQSEKRIGFFIGVEQFSFPGNSNEFSRSYVEEKEWMPSVGVILQLPNLKIRHRIEFGNRIRNGELNYNVGSLGGGNWTNLNFRSSYLYLKLLGGLKTKKNPNFYFELGPNLGFRYQSRVEGEIRNYCAFPEVWGCSNDYEEIDDNGQAYFRSIEIGVSGILGVEYNLGEKVGVFLELNGDFSPLSGKKVEMNPVLDKLIKTGIYFRLQKEE